MATVNSQDRFRGSLVGLAVGDALGTTIEFEVRDTYEHVDDMVGGGPFELHPGQWTDDTSMALCLANSLLETGAFDPLDQMKRYIKWWREGYLSSNGYCFDIGITTSDALSDFENTGDPFSGPADPFTAGNGSLMRLAPVPMFYAANPVQAIHYSGESSRTTHGAQEAIDACRYFASLLVGAFRGLDKAILLSPSYSPVLELWHSEPLSQKISEVADGSYKSKTRDEISSSGYVVHTLEAVLWAFHKTDNFRDGALLVVNLGDDADTTGAIYGQIAGAHYGWQDIPSEWRGRIAMSEEIESWADNLHDIALAPTE